MIFDHITGEQSRTMARTNVALGKKRYATVSSHIAARTAFSPPLSTFHHCLPQPITIFLTPVVLQLNLALTVLHRLAI